MKLKIFLWSLLALPPSLHMVGIASSYSLGIMALICIFFLFELASQRLSISHKAAMLVLGLISFVVLHFCAVMIFRPSPYTDISRALLSLFLLALLIITVDICSRYALYMKSQEFHQLIRRMALVLIALGLTSVISRGFFASLLGLASPIAPFAEPSHYALALVPFAMYGFATREFRITAAFLCLIPLMILEIKNLTFFVAVIIIFSLRIPKSVLAVVVPALLFGSGIFIEQITSFLLFYELDYYVNRISFEESQNLSVLVYQQGIEVIQAALYGGNSSGVGFQQLGLGGLDVESARLIDEVLRGGSLNNMDGGFIAAKLFGEFGLVATCIILVLVWTIVTSYYQVHKHQHGIHQLSPQILFANCCIASWVIELSVRGMGYFSIGSSLFLFSALLLSRKNAQPRHNS